MKKAKRKHTIFTLVKKFQNIKILDHGTLSKRHTLSVPSLNLTTGKLIPENGTDLRIVFYKVLLVYILFNLRGYLKTFDLSELFSILTDPPPKLVPIIEVLLYTLL